MGEKSFNLTTEPWLKVIDQADHEKMVSLIELFENAPDYQRLAGDMQAQDLAVFRLLLAILTTVYSRVDMAGNAYDWAVAIEQAGYQAEAEFSRKTIQRGLLKTWRDLYRAGAFSTAVTKYLQQQADRFDLFGERPFYQATTTDYDALVPTKKRVATGNGQVAIKQINRQVSESGSTPAIFAPKAGDAKNTLTLAELTRWLVTYQNFTGVTDKTKIETTEKFANSAGWVYRLSPVFANGESLFETLMLNLVLTGKQDPYAPQLPVWEESIAAHVARRKQQVQPNNLAELYTTWSRILHIEWTPDDHPTIFSAGLPIFEADNAFIEPMTTWRHDKKTHADRPAVKGLRSLSIAMWRNFGQYVKVNESAATHEPGIVVWLRDLKDQNMIPDDKQLALMSVGLVSDGNVTSQAPAAEIVDDMRIKANVLFDTKSDIGYWPEQIEDVILMTQTIGKDYYRFLANVGRIRNLDATAFANKLSVGFYDRLNAPFKAWLAGLSNHDERSVKVNEWKETLRKTVFTAATDVMQSSSSRDITGLAGEKGPDNIFTAKNWLQHNVKVHLS
ncbi:type I-E CRISPR-associated protein Cse1/CasA [Levilactobacillus suantsaii]|uniref:Type I-E CRISPR-associated protein Cse1/CasA n=1 Tax=Levilactobacillus suantsaii TaxID=2292255 RepID=A0A4Q0VJI4_9LACO|nr:type I-E CRISPR-associated protein Cse1/CasA [Levilactobacillus suantsaii]QMU08779.1 type I-E CRISPR-associated protein Cse1/CasA [Levilactobacillus suantsaii]RXI78949.1 type I-E CRISPR-associated protein Cse1/CasA [Levilactobacillus suantsaii]